MEWKLLNYAFGFVLVMLVIVTDCKIKTSYAVVGGKAFLNFSYSCNATRITVQHANAAPFFNSRSINPPSSNLEVRNGTDGEVCFLNFTFNHVTKDDAGGYTLLAYKNDPSLYEDDRILLNVRYPPGKASCSSVEYIHPDWIQVHCTAPVGTVGGYIICYQDGDAIAPLNSPQENDRTLSQTLLAKVGSLVYCCSSTLGKTKDSCECKDTVWDPIQNNEVTDFADPCPPTEPIPHPVSSHYPEEIPLEYTSGNGITNIPIGSTISPERMTSWTAIHVLVGVICLLILVNIFSIAGIVYYFKHQKKIATGESTSKTINGEQTSFIVVSDFRKW